MFRDEQKKELADSIYSRLVRRLSTFTNNDREQEYEVSYGQKNGIQTIVIKRVQNSGISYYVVKEVELVLKDYRLSPVFYFIEIDKEKKKPTIEIFIA